MHWISFIILLVLVTLLDAGNLPNYIAIGPMNVRPDMLLVVMVFFAVNSDIYTATITSFMTGLAVDVSSSSIGPYMISFGIVGSLVSLIDREMIMKRRFRQGLLIFFVGIAAHGLAYWLTILKPGGPLPNAYIFLVWNTVFSAAVTPLVWMVLSGISPVFGINRYRFGGL